MVESPHFIRTLCGSSFEDKRVLTLTKTEEGVSRHKKAHTNGSVDSAKQRISLTSWDFAVYIAAGFDFNLMFQFINVPTSCMRITRGFCLLMRSLPLRTVYMVVMMSCPSFGLEVKGVLRVDNK